VVEAKPRGLRVAGLSALCIAVIANLVMGATVAFAAVPISRWAASLGGGVPPCHRHQQPAPRRVPSAPGGAWVLSEVPPPSDARAPFRSRI